MECRPKTILVIEDELSYQKALEKKLDNEGFRILTANDGSEGLSIAFAEHPDLILLDLVMPGQNGVMVLDQLRRDEWGKDALVAIISNFSGEGPVSQVLANNVTYYFVKSDTTLENLVNKISDLLSTQRHS